MSPEEIRATGEVVRLTYKPHPLGQPTNWAKTFDVVTGAEKDHLKTAHIKLIEDGIKISGFEGFENKVQLWWCVPLTPEQNAELKAGLARIRPSQPQR